MNPAGEDMSVFFQWGTNTAYGNITPVQLKEIKALVDAMERSVKDDDARNYHLLNLKFHDRLVEMAGNRKLTAIYRKLIKELALFRRLNLADGWLVKFSEDGRNLDQNAAMWPILQEFSEQLLWPVNGVMVKLEPEEWKALLSAAFRQEQPRVAAGLNGGMVMLGQRTSKFSKKEFSDWLEFLHATADDRGIKIVLPAIK